MQKKFWLQLALITCVPTVHASDTKISATKKTHKFQKNDWLLKANKTKIKKLRQLNPDDRYELQISASHNIKNSTFPLREKIDIDQETIHKGRTTTKAAAHFDAEGA